MEHARTNSQCLRATPSALALLVMQPTPFCNIACDYCYLAHRANTQRMSFEVVAASFRNVCSSGLLSNALSVIWHAGEPLAAPPSFYSESFRLAREELPRDVEVRHCIQTNGILIDERWCDLFAQWQVRIGVSIDGPAFLHDRHRLTRDGKPTHARVMQGIEWLKRRHLPFHVIAVVTRESLPHAAEIMRFFIEHEIGQVGFNIDEAEGQNPRTSMRGMEAEYVSFMRQVDSIASESHFPMSVRELEQAKYAIRHDIPQLTVDGVTLPNNSQVIPGAIVSIDHLGRFTSWSPELLDLKHDRFGDFVLGNVLQDSIAMQLRSPKALAIQQEITLGVDACRRQCGFFASCGGGAPVNKLAENGAFSGTETVYCRCTVQAPLRVVLERMEADLGLTPAASGVPSSAALVPAS